MQAIPWSTRDRARPNRRRGRAETARGGDRRRALQDNWDSLPAYKPPHWYHDAKFGIFIHWGVYSVPAFGNEWYPRNMYLRGHCRVRAPPPDVRPARTTSATRTSSRLHRRRIRPRRLGQPVPRGRRPVRRPGRRAPRRLRMYDTDRTRWNASAMGPSATSRELAEAVRDQAMVLGASTHRAEHWWFMNGGTRSLRRARPRVGGLLRSGAARGAAAQRAVPDRLVPAHGRDHRPLPPAGAVVRLVDRAAGLRAVAAQVRRLLLQPGGALGPGVVINYKWDAFEPGTAVFDVERGALAGSTRRSGRTTPRSRGPPGPGSRATTTSRADDMIAELVDVVSKNGVLLLNVGPKPDGTIADEEQELLRTIGPGCGQRRGDLRHTALGGRRGGPDRESPSARSSTGPPRVHRRRLPVHPRGSTCGDYVYAIPLAEPADPDLAVPSLGSGSGLVGGEVRRPCSDTPASCPGARTPAPSTSPCLIRPRGTASPSA